MELEETPKDLEAARKKLVQLAEAKQVWESQIAPEVSRDKSYNNDMLRGIITGECNAQLGLKVTLAHAKVTG